MTHRWCVPVHDGLRLAFHVSPNARKTEVMGLSGDALKIRLQAPPVDGKANEALVRFVAETLRVPRSTVHISHGLTNRKKLVEVRAQGLTVEAAVQAFGV